VSAADGAEAVSRSATVVVDTTLGGFSVSPAVASLNGDGKADPLQIAYVLTRQASVKVQIRRNGKVVHSVLGATQSAGPQTVTWDGRAGNGKRVADGAYTAVVLATTSLGTRLLSRPVKLDTKAPVIRVLSLRTVNGTTRLRFSLSEAAQVRIYYGRRRWNDGDSVLRNGRAGEQAFSRRVRASVVRIVAIDRALNRGAVIYRQR